MRLTLGTWSRLLSLTVAAIYVYGAAVYASGKDAGFVAVGMIVPLACIWFAEEMGAYTGMARLHAVNTPTHPAMMHVAGWIVLLSPLVARVFV